MNTCLKEVFEAKTDKPYKLKRGHIDKFIKKISKHYQEMELEAFDKLNIQEE